MTVHYPARRRSRATIVLSASLLSLTALAVSLFIHGPTLILWNASPSVPIGLYAVLPHAPLHVGYLAVADLPPDIRVFAQTRGYLPVDVHLIKPVAAIKGAYVCRRGLSVTVDNLHLADALETDRRHRPMPDWQDCRRLDTHDIFLMNPHIRDSFDGRYFGPIDQVLVRGRAFPLLTFRTAIEP